MKTSTRLATLFAVILGTSIYADQGIAPSANVSTIKTNLGRVYTNCRIFKRDPDGVIIAHQYGGAKVLYADMTEETRAVVGYDPEQAAAYEKERAEKKRKDREALAQYNAELAKAESRRLEFMAEQRMMSGYGATAYQGPGYGDLGYATYGFGSDASGGLGYGYGGGYQSYNSNCGWGGAGLGWGNASCYGRVFGNGWGFGNTPGGSFGNNWAYGNGCSGFGIGRGFGNAGAYGHGNNGHYGNAFNGYYSYPVSVTRGHYTFPTPCHSGGLNVIGHPAFNPPPCRVPLATPAIGHVTPALGAGRH